MAYQSQNVNNGIPDDRVARSNSSEALWPPPQKGNIRQVIINKDLKERDGQTYMRGR